MNLGSLMGKGERSKIYQHPENYNLVIKVTKYAAEKKVLNYFFKNPSPFFVKVYDIFLIDNKMYAVLDKVENADFRFENKNSKNGMIFMSKFNHESQNTLDYFKSNVIDNQIHLVDEYFDLINNLWINDMCDHYDTAWNIGFLNGKMVCFDTTIR